MTFNIETPADQTGDQGQPSQQPSAADNAASGADNGITAEQLNEILKRDEHAQKHIKTLEEENEQVRQNFIALQEKLETVQGQLNSREKLEQLLAGKNTSTDNSNQEGNLNNMNTPTSQLGQDDIDSLVNQRIQGYMQEKEQEKNLNNIKASLNEVFKDKADDHVKQVAQANGISFEEAMDMAKKNPALFNNVFVNPFNKGATTPAAPTFGSQSTSSVPNTNNGIDMEHWNKLRRENPTKFFSVETQKAFHQWFHNNQA